MNTYISNITIIIPELLTKDLNEALDNIAKKYPRLYSYSAPKNSKYNLNKNQIILMDRYYDEHIINNFYNDIMEYWCEYEYNNILREVNKIRNSEVVEKWVNGNFNFWVLEE